ncbi:hypothetical protein D9619_012994 [Psilocybe cf. subviscida]|uniref:ATP-dependent DNA helicase n=1 Tax=Psilocybe cf. subviscida TaxID=2480587 RepID=A0A8H5BID1_9AGAR|nr:hypothetical protein D9619_012994 [Psilocybe cf. subviscida]
MFKSNTEVKFIGSGRAARNLVFYITNYVTKPSLPMHVGMVALKYAIGKVGEKIAETVDGLTASFNTSAVIMAVNSMMGRQEISQPQVMAELIGGGDHYTSETFSTLNWGQVLSYVDSATSHEEEEIGDARNDALDSNIPMNVDIRSDSVTASTQTLDYMFRNEEQSFDLLCLYDFAATTCKTSIPKSLLLSREIEDIPGSFSSWDHPQRSTHHLNHRRHPHVPVLLGPAIPNAERSSDTREKWAKCILILFKPWRNPMDIKNDHETWLECYERYKVELSPIHQTIIRNMNAFSESQDARGTVPERSRTRVTDLDGLVARADMHLPSPTDEFDDDGDALWSDNEVPIGVNAGNSVVQDVYQCTERTLTHIAMLNNITASRLGYDVVSALDRCYDPTQIDLDQDMEVGSREVAVNDLPTIISDQTFMCEQKIKRRRPEADIPETHVTDASNRIQVVVEPQVEIMTIDLENQLRRRFPSRSGGKNVADIVQNVIEKMNLESNCEQLKAFKLVADHLVSGNIEQLLMYVSGVGGTGKSHVIKSIVELFSSLGIRNQLLLGAPTGIAAVLIGGQTLHSLAFVGPRRKGGNLEHLTSMWKDVRYLIVDEVSMIGARFLSELSNRIREAKYHHPDSCSMPFGGVNVIFMGDFGQLKPPAQTALYSHRITEHMSFKTASCIDGISAMNGVLLWRQIKKVVQLVKNHRQAGDPDYAEFLSRIRLGICVPDPRIAAGVASRNDWNYLLDRVLSKLDQATLQKFDDAPIIVGTKVTRDILNAKRICYDAARLRKSVNLYHSVDTMDRVPVRIGLRNRLWNIPSSSNNDAFGRLPLFNGMKVMVTENIAFFHGVVNGSEGVVQSVYHNEDSDGNMVAVVAYVLIPGCGMHLPHLEKDVVPIFPVATRINFTIKVSNHATVKGFTRKQLPLVPAYAYTDFKSQGRTLTNVIVDLYTAKGQGVYVMLSRVKSISGLAVLRWFPPSKVYDRLSAELRNELDRLDTLSGDRDI